MVIVDTPKNSSGECRAQWRLVRPGETVNIISKEAILSAKKQRDEDGAPIYEDINREQKAEEAPITESLKESEKPSEKPKGRGRPKSIIQEDGNESQV